MNCLTRGFGYWSLCRTFFYSWNENGNLCILTPYCDSNFGGDETLHKPRSGWIPCVFSYPFTGNSRKQACDALSTPEVEYIAMWESCSDANRVWTCLAEIGLNFNLPSTIYCENASVDIDSNENPADSFTKPLQKIKFEKFHEQISIKATAKI